MQQLSTTGTHTPRVVPALHHTDNESAHMLQREGISLNHFKYNIYIF